MTTDPEIADPYLTDLLAAMDRLGRRNYPEIGVPMYLVAEDLTSGHVTWGDVSAKLPAEDMSEGVVTAEVLLAQPLQTLAPAAGDSPLGGAFARAAAVITAHKGALTAEDIAQIIEVLADRTFLDHPFSDLSGPGTWQDADTTPGSEPEAR